MSKRIRRRQPDFEPFRPSWPSASIVVVTFNTRGLFIEKLFESLRQLDYPDYEVIVVDNGSRDETRAVLERCRTNEILIFNDKNHGFAGGCNDGIARARGEVTVLLNFDTEVQSDWLTEIVRPLVENPRAAIVGSKIYYPGTRQFQHAGGILHGNGMGEHAAYREEDHGQCDTLRDVDFVTGASMAIRRRFLDLCGGGLDKDYFPAYGEDSDLCYRAHLMGYEVLYAPKSVLYHHESPVLENQSPAFRRLIERGRMIFCIKNLRLYEWFTRFLPYEIYWLRMPWSKGRRRQQIRAYLDGLAFFFGRRYTPDKPFTDL